MHRGGSRRLFSGWSNFENAWPTVLISAHANLPRQNVESSGGQQQQEEDEDSDEGDIEAQIQRELAGMQPSKDKKRPFAATQLDMPCGAYLTLGALADAFGSDKSHRADSWQ